MTRSALPGESKPLLEPLDEAVDHVRGSPAGRLVIEYGDYECPYGVVYRGRHDAATLVRALVP